jgi:cytochrome b561
MQTQPEKYGAVEQALHWATAMLVLVAFVYGPGGSEARVYSEAGEFERRLHETLGLCVLALTVLRALWRSTRRRPGPPAMPRWMGSCSNAVQLALFALLFLVPLTAIMGAWLEGHPLSWIGGELRPLFGESRELGAGVAHLHGWLGDTILWLAGFHAAAALFHHLVLRDGVLRSMLPGRHR